MLCCCGGGDDEVDPAMKKLDEQVRCPLPVLPEGGRLSLNPGGELEERAYLERLSAVAVKTLGCCSVGKP